jgi:methyltransferase (TIGR00027 family)
MTPVGMTSRWVAASRACESERPHPLFDDPYARALAGEEGFAMLSESWTAHSGSTPDGSEPYLAIRTRFFDDALLSAAVEIGLRQVVILAAGMDSRAFRLAWPSGVALYEVDRDDVFDHKEGVLTGLGATPRCARTVVRVDLESDWITPLIRAGFDPEQPAAILMEGLLVYLEKDAVVSLLSAVRRIAAPGSWLGVDLVGNDFLSSLYLKPFMTKMKQFGCAWRFGVDHPESLLASYGWTAKVVQPGERGISHGRWPYPVFPRGLPGFPRTYLATARRV